MRKTTLLLAAVIIALSLQITGCDTGIEASFYCGRAETNQANKDFDGAIKNYKHSIDLDPEFASAYSGLGLVFSELGNHTDAMVFYRKAVETAKRRKPKSSFKAGIYTTDTKEILKDLNSAFIFYKNNQMDREARRIDLLISELPKPKKDHQE